MDMEICNEFGMILLKFELIKIDVIEDYIDFVEYFVYVVCYGYGMLFSLI